MTAWDILTIHDWAKAARPQPFVLGGSTVGCGCCSDGEIIYSADQAVATVKDYIQERQAEIARWQQWLERMVDSKEILPHE